MTTAHVRSIMKSVIASGFDPTEMQWFDISGAVFHDYEIKAK